MLRRVAFIFSICLLLLQLNACRKGCKNVECQNGGECFNGSCRCEGRWSGLYCDTLCPIGFEGRYCASLSRTKFIRTWNATTFSTNGTNQHPLYVTAGSFAEQIVISNFNNEGFTVTASMLDYDKFEILPQNATGSYTGSVEGSGYMNGQKLGINLTKQGIDYFADCNR